MQGKIRVTTPAGEEVLVPNDIVTYDKIANKKTRSSVSDAYDFAGWMHNILRFEGASLEDISKTIQRIYNIQIVFSSEELKKFRFTGTVNNNSLENVLNTVCLTSPISFQIIDQKVIFTKNNRLIDSYNY
jgi:ferric-dicitrate binding protein FerR (iron transport regulator)